MRICCCVLGVNRPGYYRWQKESVKPKRNAPVLSEIRELRQAYPKIGAGQLQGKLKKTRASYGTVRRLCVENGLMAKRKPNSTTRQAAGAIASEDLILRNFRAEAPSVKLLGDMLERSCKDGKVYVAAILDCFDGAAVGLSMAGNKKAELCANALAATVKRYGKTAHMIVHTDRGSQYTSKLYRAVIAREGLSQSMGATGCCYDNARMESFFATMEKELLCDLPLSQMTRAEVKRAIFRWVELEYNRLRPTSANEGRLPPLVKRAQYLKRQTVAA